MRCVALFYCVGFSVFVSRYFRINPTLIVCTIVFVCTYMCGYLEFQSADTNWKLIEIYLLLCAPLGACSTCTGDNLHFLAPKKNLRNNKSEHIYSRPSSRAGRKLRHTTLRSWYYLLRILWQPLCEWMYMCVCLQACRVSVGAATAIVIYNISEHFTIFDIKGSKLILLCGLCLSMCVYVCMWLE